MPKKRDTRGHSSAQSLLKNKRSTSQMNSFSRARQKSVFNTGILAVQTNPECATVKGEKSLKPPSIRARPQPDGTHERSCGTLRSSVASVAPSSVSKCIVAGIGAIFKLVHAWLLGWIIHVQPTLSRRIYNSYNSSSISHDQGWRLLVRSQYSHNPPVISVIFVFTPPGETPPIDHRILDLGSWSDHGWRLREPADVAGGSLRLYPGSSGPLPVISASASVSDNARNFPSAERLRRNWYLSSSGAPSPASYCSPAGRDPHVESLDDRHGQVV